MSIKGRLGSAWSAFVGRNDVFDNLPVQPGENHQHATGDVVGAWQAFCQRSGTNPDQSIPADFMQAYTNYTGNPATFPELNTGE